MVAFTLKEASSWMCIDVGRRSLQREGLQTKLDQSPIAFRRLKCVHRRTRAEKVCGMSAVFAYAAYRTLWRPRFHSTTLLLPPDTRT